MIEDTMEFKFLNSPSAGCKFCQIAPATQRGRDLYSERYLTDDDLNIDGMDGGFFAYIKKESQDSWLVTNEPDNEMYNRAISKTLILFCPWCGRRLNTED